MHLFQALFIFLKMSVFAYQGMCSTVYFLLQLKEALTILLCIL